MIDVPRKSRRVASAGASSSRREAAACHHCGLSCIEAPAPTGDKVFCCRGCRTVFELLSENGLGQFYQIEGARGARATEAAPGQFQFLDEPAVRAKLVDFSDGKAARVRFSLPTIHCIACVWLLENLFKLHPGIASSRVNFPRKEVAISFDETTVTLGDLASLLASLGYPPELNLSDLERGPVHPAVRRLYLQIGVAGFAFGNTMLFALSGYFGLDTFHGPAFRSLFGWLSLALSMPVVVFSAADYWKSAWTGLKRPRDRGPLLAKCLGPRFRPRRRLLRFARGPDFLPAPRKTVSAEDLRPARLRPGLQVVLPLIRRTAQAAGAGYRASGIRHPETDPR
jgi:copper chaperone CopZ